MFWKIKKWMNKKVDGKFFIKNKKGMESEMLGWWIFGLAVLVIIVLTIMVMKGKGDSALDFIKNLFRFRK